MRPTTQFSFTSAFTSAFTSFFLLSSFSLLATTFNVGPTRTYKTPSSVSALVHDSDVVVIDSAVYEGDVCAWRANHLQIYANGPVVLKAAGKAFEQKAIWVVKGNDCWIQGIDFRDCAVPDNNGAGIRVEGTNITVMDCAFRRNQDGILAGANTKSTIEVVRCVFEQSGAGDGLSHAIYIGHVARFLYYGNYTHGTVVGHEVKSRALFNYIAYNRITTEEGTGSRNIDLPNGGESYVIGNIIQHGAKTENGNVIGYGLEGLSDTVNNTLVIASNTIVNERSAATFLRTDAATKRVLMVNNIIAGTGTLLIGTADTLDTLYNARSVNIADAKFMNAAALDYRLRNDAPARGIAVPMGTMHDIELDPAFMYVHPTQVKARAAHHDMGALESAMSMDVPLASLPPSQHLSVYPNPSSDVITVVIPSELERQDVVITSVDGREVMRVPANSSLLQVDVSMLATGMYFIRAGAHTTVVLK